MFAGHIINVSIACNFSYELDTEADYYFTGFSGNQETYYLLEQSDILEGVTLIVNGSEI